MFLHIARFELRYQFRNPIFWVVAALFFLLTFGSVTIDQVQIGSSGNVHANSPYAIVQTHLIWSLFYMFVTAAFVANVIVRDDETGFGPIVRTTRVTKFAYLYGRFTGAFLAAAIAFLSVPVAIWLGSLMPWLDPETLGPNRLGDYAFAYLAMALPSVLLTSAIFFALATMTRSMMATYLGVVGFLVLYTVVMLSLASQPQLRETAAWMEPFGIAAFAKATRYWTAAESNRLLPAIQGAILWNRLIWTAIAGLALVLAYGRYRFADRGISPRAARRDARRAAADSAAAQAPSHMIGALPPTDPPRARWAQLRARAGFEMRQTFRSPAFLVLLLLGLANAVPALWFGGDLFGTPTYPVTRALIARLQGTFTIIPIIIAIYYAGELVWRDRERRTHEIIDSTPLPDWAYVLPKTLGVALVLFSTLLVSIVAAVLVQLLHGYTDFEFGKYLLWYLLPTGVDMILIAALAVFVQALSPNKYIGWAVMVLYLVTTIVLSNIGFEHNLYHYAGGPPAPLSDMNVHGGMATGAWWFRLYWGAFALILLVLAHLLWRRGTETRLKPRLRRLPRRLRGTAGVIVLGALAVFIGTGAFIYHNTNQLNVYRTADEQDDYLADYEKTLLKYEAVPQPSVAAVKLDVALYPAQVRAVTRGRYVLENRTGRPIDEIHVRLADRDLKLLGLRVEGGRPIKDYPRFHYRIYRLDRPMMPGDRRVMSFETRRWQHGFRNSGGDTRLVANGTFLSNAEIAPTIGMNRRQLLQDRSKRRKHGLVAELRPAKLEDRAAQAHNYIDADWTTADITVSTAAGQTPIAPGRKVSDRIAGGRRVARFVSDAPILNFFSIQSAAYAVKRAVHDGINLAVYYYPAHDWDVSRMLKAMALSLDYYQANFGPYQFDQARIIEFPGYSTFAQSFANTIPYSENIGFVADNRNPDKIDYVTYVTAHELAHQYWAHQIIGADMQGATVLSETLAQYSALMVMKRLYGPDEIRRFLRFELDSYLRARGGEALEELPLGRVEDQPYIHYRKGSVAMYLLQDRLGEDAVNRALRTLLAKYRFKSAPYPRSTDLIAALRAQARTPAQLALIRDLFERITIYDLKALDPQVRRRADGRWNVTMTVEAHKYYASGKGNEREVRFAEAVDLGAFTAEPGEGSFARRNVLAMDRRTIRSGRQRITIVTDKKPSFVGVDPYNMFIDRNSTDNVIAAG